MPHITNRQRIFEIVAVVLTGCCKFLFVDLLPYKFWYIIVASIFWIGYVLWNARHKKGILTQWGFSKESFSSSLKKVLPFAAFCVVVFVIFGITQDSMIVNWHIVPVLMLYPAWGIVQQFLVVALVAGNLNDFNGRRVPKSVIVLVTAIIFSAVHFPSALLVGGTFILALLYTIIYLQDRNIWALGLYHGWLGALFYFFVLNRDPWNEVFKTL